MNSVKLLDQILMIIREIKDDENQLEKVLTFLQRDITISEEEERVQLPEKFDKVVDEIVSSLDAGFVCFLNPETIEMEEVPNDLIMDPEEFEACTGETIDSWGLKHETWDKCITIEPLKSNDSFNIMEQFTDQLENSILKNQLINALNNRKPFANFKRIIDDSEIREDWFKFKHMWMKNHISELIDNELNYNN